MIGSANDGRLRGGKQGKFPFWHELRATEREIAFEEHFGIVREFSLSIEPNYSGRLEADLMSDERLLKNYPCRQISITPSRANIPLPTNWSISRA
jgi:hypothetical protein